MNPDPAPSRLAAVLGSLLSLIIATGSPAAAAQIRVACVGDSITEGSGLSNPSTESYPARLQRLLGTNYLVRNFGVSGRTLLKKGDFPYWNSTAFKPGHDFAPDIVIIKLGSNDAKPYNWKYGVDFESDFESLIDSYVTLPVSPRILLATPAPVFKNGAFDIKPGTVRTNIAPLVRMMAARPGRELIEFHDRLDGHPEWFPDTVHPNARGTVVMAAIAFQAVTGESGPEPSIPPDLTPLTPSRLRVEWPSAMAGQVLFGTPALQGEFTIWTVTDGIFVNDGAWVRTTNSPGAARYYRLWNP